MLKKMADRLGGFDVNEINVAQAAMAAGTIATSRLRVIQVSDMRTMLADEAGRASLASHSDDEYVVVSQQDDTQYVIFHGFFTRQKDALFFANAPAVILAMAEDYLDACDEEEDRRVDRTLS